MNTLQAIMKCKLPHLEPLVISEVQIGGYCEEDDITRYEDDFGRSQG